MADNEKIMHFANFNITYGPNEEPMLEHFADIIFPAFVSAFKRGKPNEYPVFYFDGVEIKKIDDEYVLVGNYIKDTQYSVHTTVQDGKLTPSPSRVPTAPYSRFVIFLTNHRMILIRNEPESPEIRSFQATVRAMLNNYIRETNRSIMEKEDKLPHALVNIVDIPLREDIEEVLKTVSKINWIRFRFFPLNNDLNPIPIAEDIDKEMKRIGSKHANILFNSPDSKSEVKSLIENSAGLAVATLEVRDANGNKTKIKEDQFTSNMKISFARDISDEDDTYFISRAKQDRIITDVSKSNLALYEKFKGAIKRVIS